MVKDYKESSERKKRDLNHRTQFQGELCVLFSWQVRSGSFHFFFFSCWVNKINRKKEKGKQDET